MKNKRPPYPKPYIDNRGTKRWRLRAKHNGNHYDIHFPGQPGDPEFEAKYHEFLIGGTSGKKANTIKRDSIDGLCVSYFNSSKFIDLYETTRARYRAYIERKIRGPHGAKRVSKIESHHIDALMAKEPTPAAGNKLRKHFHILLGHAVKIQWIKSNPASATEKRRGQVNHHKTWPEELIEQYRSCWQLGTQQRLVLEAALATGQRRQDIARMSRTHIKDDLISVVQLKGLRQHGDDTPLEIPIHPDFQAAMDAMATLPMTLFETQYGKPRSENAFGDWFKKHCKAANIPDGYTLHGLRYSAAVRLADVGCGAHEIMAITGHKDLKLVQQYTKQADQRRLARSAIRKATGTEQQQNLSSTFKVLPSGGSSD